MQVGDNIIGIYKFENKINKKVYIGQSKDIDKRIQNHFYNINNYNINTKFYRVLRKYGIENFDITILEEYDIQKLDEKEKYWIKYYNCYKEGYNSTERGDFNPSLYPDIVRKRTNTLKYNKSVNDKLSLKGEQNPRAKLTLEDVKQIRQDYKNKVPLEIVTKNILIKLLKVLFNIVGWGKLGKMLILKYLNIIKKIMAVVFIPKKKFFV